MGKLNKQKIIQISAINAKGMTVEAIAKQAGVDVSVVKDSLESRGKSYVELAMMSEEQIKLYIKGLQLKGKATAEIAGLTGLSEKRVQEYIFGKTEPEKEQKKEEPAATAEPEKAQETKPKKWDGHNKLSEETARRIIELKRQGKSNKDIAKELGVGSTSVYRIWTKYKESKPSLINKEFDEAVDKMIEESRSKAAIEETEAKEKEPAPAATDTSSTNEINSQDKDSTLLRKCQEELPKIEKDFLTMYEGMTEAEQRAWDLGEMFARIIRLRSEFI